jgi:hypothetical protein
MLTHIVLFRPHITLAKIVTWEIDSSSEDFPVCLGNCYYQKDEADWCQVPEKWMAAG